MSLELREDKVVDGVFQPIRIFNLRERVILQRLKRPKLRVRSRLDVFPGLFGLLPGIRSPHLYPGDEIVHLFFRKRALFFGWHLEVFIRIPDGSDDETLLRIAGNNGGSGISPFHPAFTEIEEQATFNLFGLSAVAFIAPLDQHRADVILEKLDLLA